MSEEIEFLKIFKYYSIIISQDNFPDFIIFNKNNGFLIDYYASINQVDISYKRIYVILEELCNMNTEELEHFLKNMLKKHFNIKNTKLKLHSI